MTTINDKLGEIRTWTDAYTMHLEAAAQAFQDPTFKRRMTVAVREAQAAFGAIPWGATGKREAMANLENQKKVLEGFERFDVEAYKTVFGTWKQVRTMFLSSDFDLREEVTFTRRPDGDLDVRQGKGSPIAVGEHAVSVAVAFLRWVGDNQTKFDPLHYTKQILAKQGIKSYEDFEANKDNFAISNPWQAGPKIILP